MSTKLLYKSDRIIFIIWLIVAIIAGVFLNTTLSNDLYSDLITFLSILIGFQITSFSILFTSSVVKELYTIKDSEDKYITLKHRLKNYYKFAFELSLLSIVLIFFMEIFTFKEINIMHGWSLDLLWVKRIIVFSIILLNIFANYKTMDFLYKVFIKDNK